jgi:hypothetical protein
MQEVRDFITNKLAKRKQIKNERDFRLKTRRIKFERKTAKLTEFYSSLNSNKPKIILKRVGLLGIVWRM